MRLAIRCRHQNVDVMADHLGTLVAKQLLGRGAEGLDDPRASMTMIASGTVLRIVRQP
jgi:hypothetical protein